jgi:hypothetical protein
MEANDSRTPTTRGITRNIRTHVAEEPSASTGKAPTAEILDITVNPGTKKVERTHQQQPYTKPMTQEKLRRSSCWSTAA